MQELDVVEALTRRGFDARYVANKEDVLPMVDSIMSNGKSVGFGGSMTMKELGMQQHLIDKGYTVYGFGYYDGEDMYQKAYASDWYFSSANAVTREGELVNIDGRSNRISAIVGGPKQVVIIVGKNKIVPDIHAAIHRIRNEVAPRNAERLDRHTPCRTTGKCHYCYNSDTMCNNTLIQHHPSTGSKMYVIVVGEELGY